MSLFDAIDNALSGLTAVQAGIQVASSNISNANTPGYSAKSQPLIANNSVANGTGGVSLGAITRATDTALATTTRQTISESAYADVQQNYLSQVQNLLGTANTSTGSTLSDAMNSFQTAWQSLAATPESAADQQNVVNAAQALATQVQQVQTGINTITGYAQSEMSADMTTLNTSLASIQSLNSQIVSAKQTNQDTTSLMDQRDAAINTVAGLMQVSVFPRSDGSIGLYTPNGVSLVDATAQSFTWNPGSNTITDAQGNDVTNFLTGGSLEALSGVLDQGSSAANIADPGKDTLYKVSSQLNAIVTLFTSTAAPNSFANAYNTTTPNPGELASGFFTGTTAGDFAVNSALTSNTATIAQGSIAATAADVAATNHSYSAAGVSVSSGRYSAITDAILATQSDNTATVTANATDYDAQKTQYQQQLQNEVGVNMDTQLAQLSVLQNSYAANAQVFNTINQMFTVLDTLTTATAG